MKEAKALQYKIDCEKSFDETGDGNDCGKCPLCRRIVLSFPVESNGVLEQGKIQIPVNPCLLISEIVGNLKSRGK
jgi:hypothetical protein